MDSEKDSLRNKIWLMFIEKGLLAALAVVAYGAYERHMSEEQRVLDDRRAAQELQLHAAKLQLEYIPRLRAVDERVNVRFDLLVAAVNSQAVLPETALEVLFSLLHADARLGVIDPRKASLLAERALRDGVVAGWPVAQDLADRWHSELAPNREILLKADPSSYETMTVEWDRDRALLCWAICACILKANTGDEFVALTESSPRPMEFMDWYLVFGKSNGRGPLLRKIEDLETHRLRALTRIGWRGIVVGMVDEILAENGGGKASELVAETKKWDEVAGGALAEDLRRVLVDYGRGPGARYAVRKLEEAWTLPEAQR